MHGRDGIVPATELKERMGRFRARMDADNPEWELAVFFGRINLYYFTGTMQDGMLLVPRDDEAVFRVRRSYERACDESLFPCIRPMHSFRDAVGDVGHPLGTVHLETELVPLAHLQRFRKHFPFEHVQPLDRQVAKVRAVKSAYELGCMERAGKVHRRVLEERVPEILREGMSEMEFVIALYAAMVEEGHQGVVRFGGFGTEMAVGQVGFGEDSLYPTCFDGPGGSRGLSPAVPLLGSRQRKLKKGDLVFVDVGCGVDGYHTDKTMTYMFGAPLPDEAVEAQRGCVEIEHRIAAMLRPGAVPSTVYDTVMGEMEPEFCENFMGFGARKVKFLGHGIGLQVDEAPVIARGFDDPLEEGMVLAVEPKKGIAGVGMVGTENTFVVTPAGGRCITGDHPGLMPVW